MDRPKKVPESAEPVFGTALWADGDVLYIRKGDNSLAPAQIRAMTDHLQTREELTEFWGRNLKEYDAGVVEAVVDWLMPADVRPPMVGNLLPEQQEIIERAERGPPYVPVDCMPLGAREELMRKVVAAAPVQITAEVPKQPVPFDPAEQTHLHCPDCGGDHERRSSLCSPADAGRSGPGLEAEIMWDRPNVQTAIVKAPPVAVVREEDRWWDDPEAMDTLKGLIGRGATDFQARWLMWFCRGMRLNPFAGEASWSTQFGRPVIDVSGYRAHANRRPEFRRMLSGKVYEGEKFSYNPMTGVLEHVIGMEQDPAKFLFAYAVVYRGDRDSPTFVTQSMKEFMPGWRPWSGDTCKSRKQAAANAGYDAFPADKLQAKAERKALAKAFSLGGLSEDDIRDGDTGE